MQSVTRILIFLLYASINILVIAEHEPAQFFTQPCDHFNARAWNCTFQQKFFLNDSQFTGSDHGTIIFIPGGESAMGGIYGYQIMKDLAAIHKGILLTMEHRFYGNSIPYNNSENWNKHVGFLSIEQAMADYANLITSVKVQYNCPACIVVAGGGSYSGKLAAYMRLKYPHVVDIALAASAPVFLDSPGLTDPYAYYAIVTNATRKLSPKCPNAVRAAIATVMDSTPEILTEKLNLCDPLPASFKDGKLELLQRIMNQFADTAMGNYPPATSPIKTECDNLLKGPLGSLEALSLFLNDHYKQEYFNKFGVLQNPRTKEHSKCYNISNAVAAGEHGRVVCSDWSGCGFGTNARTWDYQACTDVIQPLGSNNITDMFWPREWTLKWQTDHCMQRFGAKPLRKGRWLAQTMGLDDLKRGKAGGYSNVIFSNGLQDPWSAGGVLQNVSDTVVAIVMENGSHHVDLRAPNVNDTEDVIKARKQEKYIINQWITNIRQNN